MAKAPAPTAPKTTDPTTEQPAAKATETAAAPKKERAPRLDRFQFATQLDKQAGECFVFGTKLGPGASEYAGVIISPEARKMLRGGNLNELRDRLLSDRREAQALVKLTDALEVDGKIVFAGEQKSAPAPAADVGNANRKSVTG